MARRKTLPESVRAKYALAERLGFLRSELFGERGGPELARQLSLPVRTWYNYESGVTVPAEVILKIIELTSVEPMWLLHGKGPKFRSASADRREAAIGPGVSVGSLLRTALQMLEQGEVQHPVLHVPSGAQGYHSDDPQSEVILLAVDDSSSGPLTKQSGPRYLAARSEWVDAERDCRCMRVESDSMSPIVAVGAYVAFAKSEETPEDLDGKMVVAWIDDKPLVRWLQNCARYVVLRAENPNTIPATILVDLDDRSRTPRFRRVLWINTPH